jgi:DNA-binding transcriptional regulator LsrR (DeoR family)
MRSMNSAFSFPIEKSLKIPVPTPAKMDDRIITLSWEDFQSIKNVMAVVCGLEKKNAILGALRTGLFKRLIIDDRTALAVLEESGD